MHKRKQFIEIILFALILGLALFLRIRRLDTTGIWSDQSFTLNTAMRWANGGAMPLASNKSSAGFVNPPMIEYLYAIALRIWPDILSVAALTMISGMVAVAAAGWAAYKAFGKRAAFWSVLIFAVNPWSVFYSQLIWNQTMVPVFAALTFACLLLYFAVEQRPVYLILSFVWAACMTQVHPGTMVQLLTMGLIFALFWRKLRVWPLAAGVAIFALMYAPFLLYETGVGWVDVQAALEVAGQPASPSVAALLVSADLLHAQGLLGSARHVLQFDTLATVLLTLSLLYALGAGARAFVQRGRDPGTARKATGFCILLLWFTLPILFYMRSAHYLQIYYLIGQLPAHFLLIGVCLDGIQRTLERTTRRAIQVAAWAVLPLPLLLLAGWQFAFDLQFQDHRFQSHEGLTQIRHIRAATQVARRLLAERPACDLVVVSEGHSLEVSKLSLLREFTDPERVLLTDGRLALPVPTPCAVYLDALPGSRASTWLARAAAPLPDAAIHVLDETWQFYDLPAGARTGLEETASPTRFATWSNGVALTGYARGQIEPGATLPLTLTWSVEAEPPEVVYHVGTYLLTMDNQVVAQSDGPGFDSIQWQRGDTFVTWFEMPVPQTLPPDDYQIAVAFYSWPGLERVDLVTGGNTAFLEQFQVSGQ
ncbi:MAG: glycosyltransferase family 39 protein [Chloroflexi bacterium]|nr:glycosyltransferase family 39 protein [Chloroflexota bacterium]